jgi:peroxiredoxin Q/BCP
MTLPRCLAVPLIAALLCTFALAAEDPPAGLTVGKPAPAFSAKNQDDKEVSSADLKGKWVVLYFYPKDDTPGCTIQACEFSEGVDALAKLNATVIGVSADSTESHRKFIAKHKLTITLLSDPNRQIMKAYGAYVETEKDGKKAGKVVRSTAIINPQGELAFHYPTVTPKGHAAAVGAKLAELQRQSPSAK